MAGFQPITWTVVAVAAGTMVQVGTMAPAGTILRRSTTRAHHAHRTGIRVLRAHSLSHGPAIIPATIRAVAASASTAPMVTSAPVTRHPSTPPFGAAFRFKQLTPFWLVVQPTQEGLALWQLL